MRWKRSLPAAVPRPAPRCANRRPSPAESSLTPCQALFACSKQRRQAHALTFVLDVAQQSPRDQQAHEAMNVGVLLDAASSRTS